LEIGGDLEEATPVGSICVLFDGMVEKILQKHAHHTKTNNYVKHHHRPEILQAFKHLETNRLVKELNTNPGPGLTHARGRPKTYFTITQEGLKSLLADTTIPAVRFWEIIYGYSLNNVPLTADKIEECYQIVLRRYLKYPNCGFSSELDNFYNICNESLQSVIKSKKITIKQKIMEVLAMNPRITRKKLENSIDEWPDFDEPDYLDSLPLSYGFGPVDIDDNGEDTYELSLGGILFILVLIYNNHIGKLKCGLYIKEFSFEEYFDKIVSNYRPKLPLIFGKWKLLTRVLKELAIYNLIMILNKDEISSANQNLDSVILGNKDLCDGIRTISLYNAKLMKDFVDEGQRFLAKVIPKISDSDFENTWLVLHKFSEASDMLFPVHGDSYAEDSFEKTEQSFAEEITAFYYMNLNSHIPLRTSTMQNYSLSDWSSKLTNHTPREYLLSIFQHDKRKPSLKEWFSSWMNDLIGLQQEILQNTKKAGTFI
jgi:hypothetical protein